MATEIRYALRHIKSKKLVGYWTCDDSVKLDVDEENVWCVDSPEQAEYVRQHSTKYYNANRDTPSHNFSASELRVVKRTITIDEENVRVRLPTHKQFLRGKYGNKGFRKDKGHLKMMLELIDTNKKVHYPSWWELNEFLRLKEKDEQY